MKPPFGMYQTEAMIYLPANRLYHVLPLVSTGNFRERSRNYTVQFHKKVSGTDFSTQVFHKPSAFESEIHPSHKSSICTLGISPLQGANLRKRKFQMLSHLR